MKVDEKYYEDDTKKRDREFEEEEDIVFPEKKIKLTDTQFMDKKYKKENMKNQQRYIIINAQNKDLQTFCDTIKSKFGGLYLTVEEISN